MPEFATRWAETSDLDYLLRAGVVHLPEAVLRRKIVWQEIILACREAAPVGYLYLDYIWDMVPFIALIWVEPAQRRQGAGQALLNFAEEQARARGQSALYSSSQVDEAEPQAWHRRMGFEECGVLAGFNAGGVGEIFFRKRL